MSDTKLPYMPLYVSDIMDDRDCRMMTDADFGRYFRLLFRQWEDGHVPKDAAAAIRDAGLDPDSADSVADLLSRKFREIGGVMVNTKCDAIRAIQVQKIAQCRANGRKGGRPRKKKAATPAPARTPSATPAPKKKGDFDSFWLSVPNKIGKGAARSAYDKAIKSGVSHDEIMRGLRGYKQYEAQRAGQDGYRPLHPATWLNQERWSDELTGPAVAAPLKRIRRDDA